MNASYFVLKHEYFFQCVSLALLNGLNLDFH
jgi:hypothetical protein